MGARLSLWVSVLALGLGFLQPAFAATTGIYIDSPQGDWVGQGSEYTFSTVSATAPSAGRITVTFDGWRAELSMPGDAAFASGSYENAQRYPFQGALNPGLSVTSPGRGCNEVAGWFRVHEVQITANSVMKLAVDFVQSCDYQPAMYGTIRINSTLGQQHAEPYARAPSPLRVEEGETATLDASASFARDSELTAFQWLQTAGPVVVLSDASAAVATFTAPDVASGSTETLVFRLTVTAANGLSDSIDVTVRDADYGAARTRAQLDSAPGDWVGGGRAYAYDEDDTTITASLGTGSMTVSINGPEQWTLHLALPQGGSWQPGMYAGAGRTAFRNPLKPGIDFHGEGRGCNTILGWFEITEISIVSGQLRKLALDFVQNCEETNPPLFGAIRINSSVPVERGVLYAVAGADVGTIEGQAVWLDGSQSYTRGEIPLQFDWRQVSGPAAEIVDPQAEFTAINPPENGGDMLFELTVSDGTGLVDSDTVRVIVRGRGERQSYLLVDSPQGDYVGQGWLWLHTADNSLLTVSRNYDNGPTMNVDGDTWWTVDFAGPNNALLAPGRYEGAQRFPFQDAGYPGLDWSGDGRGCNQLSGRFDVRAMVYVNNVIQAMAIDFEQSCEGYMPAARGEVRYNIAPAALPNADAGPDLDAIEGRTVTLDGSNSRDDVAVIAFKWTQTEGQAVTLTSTTAAKPTFTAPPGWQTLAFQLDVADASGYHGFDSVSVAVAPDNVDSDGDGVRDGDDAFPNDPTETADTDGDGYGDNSDAYPDNADEHELQPDTDADGLWDSVDDDDDDDGIPDSVEALAPAGDGNGDGIADALQFGVRTFVDDSGALATLASGVGVTFISSAAAANPAPQAGPAGPTFDRGFFAMELEVVTGGAGAVTLWLHGTAPRPDAYWKHDATRGFYAFPFNGATGAELLADRTVLHFIDGARGDADGSLNGRIVDPGAPAWGSETSDPQTSVGDTTAGGSMSLGGLLLLALTGRRRFRACAPLLCAGALAACGQSAPMGDPSKVGGHVWTAEPAMISHAGVYREREFVWQDYLYDDRGANTDGRDRFDAPLGSPGPDPHDPVNPRMSPAPLVNWAGDFSYASPDGTYIPNVADFIEFRVAQDKSAVHYRFRMGDMIAPDSAVIALCVDEDDSIASGVEAWPRGANHVEQLGCERLYTIWGTGGEVVDTAGTTQDLAAIGASVDADVNEALISLSVPKAYADPGRSRWRYYIAAGVWDAAAGAWQAPTPVPTQQGAPVATGGNPLAPNIYDLLSNNHEPNSTWNEEKQANDLTAHKLLEHYLDVDFARLAEARNDPDPRLTGVVVHIYHSRHPMAQGRGTFVDGANAIYAGPWVPYTAVIPGNYYEDDHKTFPFDFCMHPLGTNHNVEVFYAEAFARRDYNPVVTGVFPSTGYLGFTQITSLIDRQQLIHACVLGRGEGEGYQGGDGLVDALEVEADVHARYRIDPERGTVHGVSLGAIGTWYVSRLYPERYAAAMPYIFTSDLVTGGIAETPTLKNLYNLPVYYSIGTLDEFGQGANGDPMADQLEGYGNEYLFLHYFLREHEGRIEQDFLPFVAQLAYTRSRVKDPARVRYVFEPGMFSDKVPGEGSAYWVSSMTLRDAAAESAEVDVTSLARADQLPKHQVVLRGLYTNPDRLYNTEIRGLFRLTRAEFDALWHPEAWEPGWEGVPTITESDLPEVAVSNGFTLTAVNLGTVTLDADRMKLGRNAAYTVVTDGPLEIRFSDRHPLVLPGPGTFEGRV